MFGTGVLCTHSKSVYHWDGEIIAQIPLVLGMHQDGDGLFGGFKFGFGNLTPLQNPANTVPGNNQIACDFDDVRGRVLFISYDSSPYALQVDLVRFV